MENRNNLANAWVVVNGSLQLDGSVNTEIPGGIFKTSNGGLSWEKSADAYKDVHRSLLTYTSLIRRAVFVLVMPREGIRKYIQHLMGEQTGLAFHQ